MISYAVWTILSILIIFLGYKCYLLASKLKKKDKELNSLHRSTEKKVQKNQEFISSLSQELRTPLYGIMGLTNILYNEHPELEHNKNLKSLKFSGDYLLTLINNVLQVNILESDTIITDKRPINLRELTQNIVHSFGYATENSGNTLDLDFDEDIPEKLQGNPAILSQILMNLISNALRFTKNGNIVFSVNLINKKGKFNNISFKIKHDGNEVSKEEEKSIYREFIDIHKVKKSYLGTGINSTIVKRLAKSIDGEIILQNNSQAGSEYAFVINLETINPNSKDVNQNEGGNNKQKALIVDDNKLNLLVADKILSKENFECTTIDNGFDAIELAKDHSYDIILMDINMPKLNGIGTTKRIREFDNKTPIIALTAVDVTQLNRQIMQAGLNDYILKPYDKNILLEMIHKHVQN
ncbi:His Kinase A (phospho-acceptor) domain-containing protein [Aquimarina amphilecti]|uniref:histidine kinase n=1 Tax=Aquimarina amphilecti TaxID=1038014 RepID=A0A1H7HNP2_AQUAM|nr:response regulator [Aquimarina amphilecti]SEK51976.1 His Kinase A (phospho-acceptor) domain-containing protein [Aquimarina amphilecti]